MIDMAKFNKERRTQIRNMRQLGWTYAKIGAYLDPPVTRQAVYDIARKLFPKVIDKKRRKA